MRTFGNKRKKLFLRPMGKGGTVFVAVDRDNLGRVRVTKHGISFLPPRGKKISPRLMRLRGMDWERLCGEARKLVKMRSDAPGKYSGPGAYLAVETRAKILALLEAKEGAGSKVLHEKLVRELIRGRKQLSGKGLRAD